MERLRSGAQYEHCRRQTDRRVALTCTGVKRSPCLKVSLLVGAVLSAPVSLYQLWAFITPGLKRNEKRYGIGFVAVSTTLFALGAVLAYISLFAGLELLLSLAGDGVVGALTAQDYIGFMLSLLDT
jgi:sec-independent protein translocase protein TatC